MSPVTCYQIGTSVHARRFDDEIVVLHLAAGIYFSLDAVGAIVWDNFAAGKTPEEVVAAVVADYDVDEMRARADVRRLLEELLAAGLLERRSPPDGDMSSER